MANFSHSALKNLEIALGVKKSNGTYQILGNQNFAEYSVEQMTYLNSNFLDFEINNANDVYSHDSYCHSVMKDIFYRLLSDKYVDSHNPGWR